tara:strand:- start:165 stop:632 length:468 start_codon:yes stop_codon:yes gene_type:complete
MAYKQPSSGPFKLMGSSPAKQLKPRDKSMEPIGPRGPKGYFKTTIDDGTNTPATVETKPIIGDKSKGPVITGDTEVKTTQHSKYTVGGKKASKIRGMAPDKTTSTTVVGPKGKQKGKTTVSESEGGEKGARTYKVKGAGRYEDPKVKYNPKKRSF